MNLWDTLMGESGGAPVAPKGSPILCTCGRRIGVVTSSGDVWRAEYHHTSAGAADVLCQIVLEDAETLVAMERRGELLGRSREIADTLRTFFQLANPEKSGDVSTLAAVLPRLVVPAQTYARAALNLDAGRLRDPVGAVVPAGCKKCRLIFDVREVIGRGVRNKRGALLVGDCRPAEVANRVYIAPAYRVLDRVALYQRLNVVLSSKHSASLVGEVSPVK
ncbi:hypothetical protein ACFY2Y_09475 [Janibacter hoylei]|uniref:hypothetical protein n=1 Tax=Janibacter hoylei TaxID=364298 RepID=UPI0036902BD6